MFTGLIEDIGAVERVDRTQKAKGEAMAHGPDALDVAILHIAPHALPVAELALGESIAVDGVCLTVTRTSPPPAGKDATQEGLFTVLAGAETLRRTTLGKLQAGDRVNLERALRLGDRLGGHMVSGHVDAVGHIRTRDDQGSNVVIQISAPDHVLRYVIEKGSIAVDGISLTINHTDASSFSVALIPHTVSMTTLASKATGAPVNLEVDPIGKYVEKLCGGYR